MKSNVIIKRPMGDFEVLQRTKDGYFNASSLSKQWNAQGKSRRDVGDFLKLKSTQEFIKTVIDDANADSTIVELLDYNHFIKDLRVKNANNKWEREVYMNPYIFIKFAMFLSPKFELQVIKFVYDQLIQHRHKAGDNYRLLTASISVFPNVDYVLLAKALNFIVFGKHYKNIRNDASEEQLQELHEIEQKISFAIDMGYVKNFDEVMQSLRKIWNDKNQRF